MINFNDILQPEVQKFIKANENEDLVNLVLKGSPFKTINIQSIAQQIKGRQVAKAKFPNLYKTKNIVYPPKLNLEQASSEETALYKSKFFQRNESVLDLTGGFGIDTLSFASKSDKVEYCEINSTLFAYATHNFKTLQKDIKTNQIDGVTYLKNFKEKFDWLYIDPARRDEFAKKVFKLDDCTPNILENLDVFRSAARFMMVKASPMLDINLSLKQLSNIIEVHIVAHKNEVKELLLILDFKTHSALTKIKAINLKSGQKALECNVEDLNMNQNFSMPLTYLYEPNSALMKAGCFGKICESYNIAALAENSHLFTSDSLIDFPGRRFEITKVTAPKKKEINKHLPSKKANISTRNYPLTPNQIKEKYKIKDGGLNFVFFTENLKQEKIVLICNKIS